MVALWIAFRLKNEVPLWRASKAGIPGRKSSYVLFCMRWDIVFASTAGTCRVRRISFVHGCFWHQHDGCKRAKLPTTNTDFWQKKLTANKKRDAHIAEELEKLGWRVLVIWECELKNREALCEYIRQCLPNERKYSLAPHMGESRR